jgi:subfamily B ATP-binding cassette protein MsbA
VSLIPRFYDPTSGRVVIEGSDIREYRLKSLRDQMSFVLQDTILFRTTIWENIAYGRPGAPAAEIKRAAELANAAEFIEAMPTATTRWSATAASRFPAASASASPSRARSSATRRS